MELVYFNSRVDPYGVAIELQIGTDSKGFIEWHIIIHMDADWEQSKFEEYSIYYEVPLMVAIKDSLKKALKKHKCADLYDFLFSGSHPEAFKRGYYELLYNFYELMWPIWKNHYANKRILKLINYGVDTPGQGGWERP